MKKRFKLLCAAAIIASLSATPTAAVFAASTPDVSAISAYSVEQTSGAVLFAKNECERRPIASMTKIMTLVLTFEAIDAGNLSLADEVTVSANASGMGGSQAFLDEGSTYSVETLVESAIVASANDSCVALAEKMDGSVEGFVSRMNDRAASLGMADTRYANCTGLPAPEQYSCAKDVATISRQLFKHPDYYRFSQTWMKDLVHPSGRVTGLTNTNRLIRSLNGCDGGKTGYTREAGFCISATAKREDMRLISVIMGEADSKVRFSDASKLLNYGFANYGVQRAVAAGDTVTEIAVAGGKQKTVPVTVATDVSVFGKKNEKGDVTTKIDLPSAVAAPVKKGDVIGKIYVARNGEVVGESDLIADADVESKTFGDAFKDIISRF